MTVHEAGTGAEALAALRLRPDLVLLDINLPDIDGFEVCRRIKENPDTASVLVLHLSASNVHPKDQVTGLETGADGYLTEPVEPSVLIANVNALLRIRRAEEGLRRSNESLRSLTDMLSHELREPLREILISSELLEQKMEDRFSPDEQDLFTHVRSGASRLNSLVESVLVYSRTVYDMVTATEISSQEAFDSCLLELQLLIHESGAKVICDDPLPPVRAEMTSLIRVFSNLIRNSIKYRSETPPEVRVTAAPDGPFVRFCVADNGIGIDPRHHQQIFEAFRRLHGKERSGVGIGLSLCRRVVQNFGGSIWVESALGQGSRFCFTLPRP
jgi:signal transduction histidine kinase